MKKQKELLKVYMQRNTEVIERKMFKNEISSLKNQISVFESTSTVQDQHLEMLVHDIKNSLGVIRVANHLLLAEPETSKKNLNELINKNIDYIVKLTEELCESIPTNVKGKNNLLFKKCNLNFIINETLFNYSVQQRKLLVMDLNDTDDMWGNWDAFALKRVLINLISNAIKHGDNKKNIYITSWADSSSQNFKITNFGSPIVLGDQKKIFDKNFKMNSNGSGIGLAVVKNIVTLHNGAINLKSNSIEGTTFFVSLPKELLSLKCI